MKVCHITSAHESSDSRIFMKECRSLAQAGYETYLVAQGDSREESGVHVVGCGSPPASRKERMSSFSRVVVEKALSLDCALYHMHDPELLPFAKKLHRMGKKVIFDSHEDVSMQILSKTWIPKPLRALISKSYTVYENHTMHSVDGVICATPYICEKFRSKLPIVETVCNYPLLEHAGRPLPYGNRTRDFGYTGICISEDRGAKQMILACAMIGAHLDLFGRVEPQAFAEELQTLSEGHSVTFNGKIPYVQLQDAMQNLKIGFLIEHPTPNAMNALCIKMFEYMSHGIPIICSNIPLWKEIIERHKCGICVDPMNVEEVAAAGKTLKAHPDEAERMGMNGYRAVISQYSWPHEAELLVNVYQKILKKVQ